MTLRAMILRSGRAFVPAAVVAAALLAAGGAVAQEAIGDPDSERYAELEKARSSFRETWVLPGADFSQYSKIYFWEGQYEYREVKGGGSGTTISRMSSRNRNFPIDEADRREFEQIVADAFSAEMQKGKNFTVVDQVGPDTLIVRGALLDIVSLVPPQAGTGRIDTYLSTIGEATFAVELLDSETGTLLAMVSERKKIQPPGGGQIDQFTMRANRVTVMADIKRWAGNAASQLRKELDKAMGGR